MTPYKAPSFKGKSFNCPFCQVYASMSWWDLHRKTYISEKDDWGFVIYDRVFYASCYNCNKHSIWVDQQMVLPDTPGIPPPSEDLSEEIQADYHEAGSILSRSPRGAAALLRLALQKLCMQLGTKGERIDDDIAELVRRGLPAQVQQAMDAIRVIGNDAVHPGQIDISDDRETATVLFELINFIAYGMITQPRAIDHMYKMIPQSKRDYIEQQRPNKGLKGSNTNDPKLLSEKAESIDRDTGNSP